MPQSSESNTNVITVRRLFGALSSFWNEIKSALEYKADTSDVTAIQTRLTTAENNIANISQSGTSYTEATTADIDSMMSNVLEDSGGSSD